MNVSDRPAYVRVNRQVISGGGRVNGGYALVNDEEESRL